MCIDKLVRVQARADQAGDTAIGPAGEAGFVPAEAVAGVVAA